MTGSPGQGSSSLVGRYPDTDGFVDEATEHLYEQLPNIDPKDCHFSFPFSFPLGQEHLERLKDNPFQRFVDELEHIYSNEEYDPMPRFQAYRNMTFRDHGALEAAYFSLVRHPWYLALRELLEQRPDLRPQASPAFIDTTFRYPNR